jgi:hypothetical protein
MKKSILVLPALLSMFGCASHIEYDKAAGLAVTSNTQRNFVVQYGDGQNDPLKRCLEAPGPATALNDLTVNTELSGDAGKVTDGKVKLDVKNTESLAKLYEVSSILQFAHAMTYRLCEAAINDYIPKSEYQKEFNNIITATKDLLEKQLEIAKEETKQVQAKAAMAK